MEKYPSDRTPGAPGQHTSPVQPSAPFSADGPPKAPSTAGTTTSANHQLFRRSLPTTTACTSCRAKRAKCDGLRPCSRCKGQKDVDCVYEIPVRQSKESLRNEIERLRQRQRSNDRVFAALVEPSLLKEVLARLNTGQSVEHISVWLEANRPSGSSTAPPAADMSTNDQDSGIGAARPGSGSGGVENVGDNMSSPASARQQGPSHPVGHRNQRDIALRGENNDIHFGRMDPQASDQRLSQSQVSSWVDSVIPNQSPVDGARYQRIDEFLAPLNFLENDVSTVVWTNITSDNKLIQHLLALYFCWEYPTFASLSKEHFLRDFQTGSHRYCSPILVNALLALGCRFSTQLDSSASPNVPYNSGERFFKEAQRLLEVQDNRHCLTTIQALGVLAIREASCGRVPESWDYVCQGMQLAIDMGLHQVKDEGNQDQNVVNAVTFWGAFALDQVWSLSLGSLSRCSTFPILPPKPPFFDNVEASLWIPYTGDGLQRSYEQRSNVRSVYTCSCELSELAHWSLGILYAPNQVVTSQDILSVYARHLDWYDGIPDILKLGHNFTPTGFFVHLYYHFRILLLFRPLIKFRILWSSIIPRDVCSQAANAIQGLMHSYSQLYTLKRTPFFVPYIAFTSSITRFINWTSAKDELLRPISSSTSVGPRLELDADVAEAIIQGIKDQAEMAPFNGLAEKALEILQGLAKKWSIDVATGDDRPQRSSEPFGRSKTGSFSFHGSNTSWEEMVWTSSANTAMSPSPVGSESRLLSPGKAAALVDNPLFLSIPSQQYSIALAGAALEEAGFASL